MRVQGTARWEGGEPTRRPKPFLKVGAVETTGGGQFSKEFQKAIGDSIELEKRDHKK